MAEWWLVWVYCGLFVATNITNKYVLSVLHFTYPTLFQEWQTLVGVIVLYIVSSRGFIKLTYDRSSLLPWLPAMMFFVLNIYSGSKALSKLLVPAFVTIQNLVDLPAYAIDNVLYPRTTSLINKASMVCVLIAAALTWATDPQRNEEAIKEGHVWMLIHVLSMSAYSVYSTVMGSSINLSDMDKLFFCYLFSVIALSPASVILGDIMLARDFPHWYLYRFYIGCVLSGLLGASMNIAGIYLGRCPNPSLISQLAVAYAKAALVLASVAIFEGTITSDFALSVLLGISAYSVFIATKTTIEPSATDKQDKREVAKPENI